MMNDQSKEKVKTLLNEHSESILGCMYALLASTEWFEYSLCSTVWEALEVEFDYSDTVGYISCELSLEEVLFALGFKKPKRTWDDNFWWSPGNKGIRLRKIKELLD